MLNEIIAELEKEKDTLTQEVKFRELQNQIQALKRKIYLLQNPPAYLGINTPTIHGSVDWYLHRNSF